jgi:hypothetical protein
LKALQKKFESFHYNCIPVLLAELGCLSEIYRTINGYEGQRIVLEAEYLVDRPEFRDVFAGSFAFEYPMEYENAHRASPYPSKTFGKQDYGLGYFEPEGCNDIDVPCNYQPLPSFDNLEEAYTLSGIVNFE